jgi:hypothetical protein
MQVVITVLSPLITRNDGIGMPAPVSPSLGADLVLRDGITTGYRCED